jgi:hypothetical protein
LYGVQLGFPTEPSDTGPHVPSVPWPPDRLHASQLPLQAVSQQKPSAQKPV